MKKISMSDYLETLVADYLTNYGMPLSETPEVVSETETSEPPPEAPKKRAKRSIKKDDTE